MMKSISLYILLMGGVFLFDNVSISSQDVETPQQDQILQNNEENEQSNTESSNQVENPEINEETDKTKILESAKIYQCVVNEGNTIQLAILKNGDAYILYNNTIINKIYLEEINPEDVQVVCDRNEITLDYKKPLSNVKYHKIFKFKDNEIELIGSKKHDQIQDYIEELFLKALEGKKSEIIKLKLMDLSFSYQYINNESIYNLLDRAIKKSLNVSSYKAISIFESAGILSTKLVYYYNFNQILSEQELQDFKNWISALEQIGIENYENFFLRYAEILLKTNPQNGLEILKYLTNIKENNLEPYILLGNYYWMKNQKEQAKEYYRKALDISKTQLENHLSIENNQNSVKIPEYIYVRVGE